MLEATIVAVASIALGGCIVLLGSHRMALLAHSMALCILAPIS